MMQVWTFLSTFRLSAFGFRQSVRDPDLSARSLGRRPRGFLRSIRQASPRSVPHRDEQEPGVAKLLCAEGSMLCFVPAQLNCCRLPWGRQIQMALLRQQCQRGLNLSIPQTVARTWLLPQAKPPRPHHRAKPLSRLLRRLTAPVPLLKVA